MPQNTVTTIGGATRDILFYSEEFRLIDNKKDLLAQKLMAFEYGAKIYSDEVYLTYGGGGANTAVSFAGLGIKTQILTAVGDDVIGHDIIKHLTSHKVSVQLAQRQPRHKTGLSFVFSSRAAKDHIVFAARGANKYLDLSREIARRLDTPWIYLTSLSGAWQSDMRNLVEQTTRKNSRLAWNPGQAQLRLGLRNLAKFIGQVQVFNVNRDEALQLLVSKHGNKVVNNPNNLLRQLHQYGQKITAITDGANGAYVYDGRKIYYRPALKKKTINTTGAGDAFGSGLVAGLIKYDDDLERALKLAIYNSNSVVTKMGAQEGLLKQKELGKYNL